MSLGFCCQECSILTAVDETSGGRDRMVVLGVRDILSESENNGEQVKIINQY